MNMTQAPATTPAREDFLQAQLAGDQRAALSVVSRALDAHVPYHELFDLIRSAQIEIGRLWEEKRISVAHEHVATAISQLALATIFERAPAPRRRNVTVLVACVEGEHHDLPARLVADFLEIDGFDVTYLGGDVPVEDFVRLVAERNPAFVALSVTMSWNLDALRRMVSRLRAEHPGLPILVGGNAVRGAASVAMGPQAAPNPGALRAPNLFDELGVISAGESQAEIITAARRLVP